MFIEIIRNRKGSTPAGVEGCNDKLGSINIRPLLGRGFVMLQTKGRLYSKKICFALFRTEFKIILKACGHNLHRFGCLNSSYFQITVFHFVFGRTIPAGLYVYRKIT